MKKIINIIVDSAVPSCGKSALCHNLELPDSHYFYEKDLDILNRLESLKYIAECDFFDKKDSLVRVLEQQINTELYIMFNRAFKIIEKKAICPNTITIHKRSIFSNRAYLDLLWDKDIVHERIPYWDVRPNYKEFVALWKTMIDCLDFNSKNTMVVFLDKEDDGLSYKKAVLDLYEFYNIQVLKYDTQLLRFDEETERNKIIKDIIVKDIKEVKFE